MNKGQKDIKQAKGLKNLTPEHPNLNLAIDEVNNSFDVEDKKPFSHKAFEVLNTKITSFIFELTEESIKNAKRTKSDGVSASHVEKASTYLVSKNRSLTKQVIGTIGGIFLGAALSNVMSITISNETSTAIGLIWIVFFTVLGVGMVAWNLLKD